MFDNLYKFSTARSRRISSYDHSGGNNDRIAIEAGETAVLADIAGSGVIRHIWITFGGSSDPMFGRNAILRMYWDGETEPSVESPIGDFFGQGWGETYLYSALPLCTGPKNGRSLVCYFPMPFSTAARITLENDSEYPVKYFYYSIDYEETDTCNEPWRFHAWWNRKLNRSIDMLENQRGALNTGNGDNHIFADIIGAGKFVGINYYVDNPSPLWYGEGDDMWQIDGEPWPYSLHGTGTEDFFNSAWCPNQIYCHPYFGYPRVPSSLGHMGRTHCYRFFIEDPVYFQKSLYASIEHGHANCLTLDIATVGYWYQSEPHKAFPKILPITGRQNLPPITASDVQQWRCEYINAHSDKDVWGNMPPKVIK